MSDSDYMWGYLQQKAFFQDMTDVTYRESETEMDSFRYHIAVELPAQYSVALKKPKIPK